MQRRARIKAVANLSSARRGTNKSNADTQQENEIVKKEPEEKVKVKFETSESKTNKDSKTIESRKLFENEKQPERNLSPIFSPPPAPFSPISQHKLRSENLLSPPPHFRSRSDTPFSPGSVTNKSRPETPFSPNSHRSRNSETCFSPLPTSKSRSETPTLQISLLKTRSEASRDTDSPGVSHHFSSVTQSPFHLPSPHPRIRTESLCSIKSTTVANLQPRKKVRTEDQKILDYKRESRERLSNKNIEKSQLRMFDMIYYNPSTNPMKPREQCNEKSRSPKKIDLTKELPPPATPPESSEKEAMPVPQLKLVNGEMVLDESSLVVENEEQKKNRLLLANNNVVYHDELSGTYGYYKRQQRTKEWPEEETVKFYRCLNTVGTDFSLMLNLFPNRSRRDLKLKFKKEEKNNPQLVDKALLNHNTFDIEELQRELDEEEEEKRKEIENQSSEVKELVKRNILKKQEAKAKAQQQTKVEKILTDGELVLNSVDNKIPNEQIIKTEGGKSVKRKRQTRKKAVKEEEEENIMKFKKIHLDTSLMEATVTVKEPPADSSVIKISSTESHISSILSTGMESILYSPSTQNILNATITDLAEASLNVQDEKSETTLNHTGSLIVDLINDSYVDTQPIQNIINEAMENDEDFHNIKQEVAQGSVMHLSSNENFQAENSLPSTSPDEPAPVPSNELDEESFLNSLDLERLAIVLKQLDGKSFYEIHEIDVDSQQISDEPLNLPRRIVDLIVSVMGQDD